jgi:hypothetical protein
MKTLCDAEDVSWHAGYYGEETLTDRLEALSFWAQTFVASLDSDLAYTAARAAAHDARLILRLEQAGVRRIRECIWTNKYGDIAPHHGDALFLAEQREEQA